jgi:hypothetical protein
MTNQDLLDEASSQEDYPNPVAPILFFFLLQRDEAYKSGLLK